MKVFVLGSQGSGSSALSWLITLALQNHAYQMLVATDSPKGDLGHMLGLGEAQAQGAAAFGAKGAIEFNSTNLTAGTLPLDGANKQRFINVAASSDITLNALAARLITSDKSLALFESSSTDLTGADVAVVVLQANAASTAFYETVKREAHKRRLPLVIVLNKMEGKMLRPTFDPVDASFAPDAAISRAWWPGVSEKNRRQLNHLVGQLINLKQSARTN